MNIHKIWDFETSSRAPESIISITDRKHMRDQFAQTMSNEQLAYLAPEQISQTAYQVDARTDLYSLGIMFFTMLSQQPPFIHQDPRTILRNILTRPLPLTQELRSMYPPIIWAIIEKLTSKVSLQLYYRYYLCKPAPPFILIYNIHSIHTIDTKAFSHCAPISYGYKLLRES